jgi:hypothetical protein
MLLNEFECRKDVPMSVMRQKEEFECRKPSTSHIIIRRLHIFDNDEKFALLTLLLLQWDKSLPSVDVDIHRKMRSLLSISLLLLVGSSSAFCPSQKSSARSRSTFLSAESATDDARRRALLIAVASAATALAVPPASAGLLDEYGSDPTKIVDKKAEQKAAAALVKPDVQIDPTLRGCTYAWC